MQHGVFQLSSRLREERERVFSFSRAESVACQYKRKRREIHFPGFFLKHFRLVQAACFVAQFRDPVNLLFLSRMTRSIFILLSSCPPPSRPTLPVNVCTFFDLPDPLEVSVFSERPGCVLRNLRRALSVKIWAKPPVKTGRVAFSSSPSKM